MKENIVIDIDDTLADMRNPLSDMLNAYSNKKLHWESWKDFNVESMYDVEYEKFFELLRDNNIIENMKLHEESVQFMHAVADMNYNVILLSARGWHDNAFNVTSDWLNTHNIPYNELIICNTNDNKSNIINDMDKNVLFVVDDSPTHCIEYAKNKNIESVFVYDMPWNRVTEFDEKRINRVYNLNQIMENICKPTTL